MQGLTQEDLVGLVNVSFQAVSKWENGNSLPDISTLPLLANILNCSIDSLLGYAAQSGLEKARQLADRMQVEVNFFQADMLDFRRAFYLLRRLADHFL